jgi:hypothetical protein
MSDSPDAIQGFSAVEDGDQLKPGTKPQASAGLKCKNSVRAIEDERQTFDSRALSPACAGLMTLTINLTQGSRPGLYAVARVRGLESKFRVR